MELYLKDKHLGTFDDEAMLLEYLSSEDIHIDDAQVMFSARELRIKKRTQIKQDVGDVESLLGTTSDTTHLLLQSFFSFVNKLEHAENLAQVRAAAKPFSDIGQSFLDNLESGKTKLPFQNKGIEKTFNKIETRATATTEALESSNKGVN